MALPSIFVVLLVVGHALRAPLGPAALSAAAACLVVGTAGGAAWRVSRRRREAAEGKLATVHAEANVAEAVTPAAEAVRRTARLDAALEDLRARAGAVRVVLWTMDGEGERALPRAVAGGVAPRPTAVRGDPLGWVLQEARATAFDSTPRWGRAGTHPTVLLVRGAPGALLLSYEFGADAAAPPPEALEGTAAELGATVGYVEASSAAAQDRQRLHEFLSVLERLHRARDLETFAAELLPAAVHLGDGTGAALALWDGALGRVVERIGQDGGPAAGATFEALTSEMGLALRAGAPLAREPYRPRRGAPAVCAPGELWATPPRAVLLLPLAPRDQPTAVLAVWSSRDASLAQGSKEVLRTLAVQAALMLETVLAYDRLRDTSERDPLTELRNRRALDTAMGRETARALRYRRPLAVVALDVDHFKGVNDRYGHAAGDAVLKRVAAVLAAGVRDMDVAARAGGEEFTLLLPETSAAAAHDVAERIREQVAAQAVPHEGSTIQVRISAGVAAWPESVDEPGRLVDAADAALYEAKRGGRDRVVVAPPARRGGFPPDSGGSSGG